MPSGEPKVPEQGFRRRVVGGFDENDVLAYVNALVNESQQQQMEYEEQIKQLQGQIDKMKKEQANARACVEKLQDELLQQTQRAEKAESDHAESEKKLAESMEQYSVSESRATGYQGKYRQSQKTLLEWQTRCQQAEEELSQLRAELAARPEKPAPAQPETPAPAPAPAPEPVQTPVPAPAPEPAPQPVSTPSIEARKILADARIYAENAERRMRREAEEQKQRMAENAKDLAAGVMVLRERLSRVDEKLSAAALDLENATAAIYAALDHTDADLESLGVKLNDFAQGTPETDLPADPEEPEQPAPPPPQPPVVPVPSAPAAGTPSSDEPASRSAERLRPAAAPAPAPAARRVRPVPKAKPAPPPPKRLRRSVHNSGSSRRAVAQSLLDAINRMSGDDK